MRKELKMSKCVTIKRRVKKENKYEEIEEKATLISQGQSTSLVKLSNGDIIKRKNKDVRVD